ncbi:LPXTG cell wall anchor domain-containing protein [Enterococcus quebecensis]|uniref:Uncharacterized protein n=1 Tax=Enterococcus quebecensis TaxID=903983 RepID=A0A1E5GV52_9ENTE|nr:LPXTG cell wall anchor domain-containing protein [Enterococcus quebecensis]OEG16507.1 hypothetical protein BCR23_06355 [Enterococcus quebecensis]
MGKNRLLVLLLVFICLSVSPKTGNAEEQNVGNQASSQASITFVHDNTPPKSNDDSKNQGKILGDLGLGQGKRLPNTGEVKMIMLIASGYLIIGILIVISASKYLTRGKKNEIMEINVINNSTIR